jgi:hypothetical protein
MFDQRLRISSWVNNTDLMVLKKQGKEGEAEQSPPIMTKNEQGEDVPLLRQELMQQAHGLVDDFTIQRTINNDEKMQVSWDPLVLGGDAKTCKAFYRAVIGACHRQELQCLMSYTMMAPEKAPSRFHVFNDWLAERAFKELSPEQYAENVVKFLDEHVPDCDGLSFDIEGLRTGVSVPKETPAAQKEKLTEQKEELLKKMGERYQRFLGSLAERLGKARKLVGVATAGLTSEKEVIPGTTADDGFRLHQYTLAKDHANMLIRPMIYDNYKINGKMDAKTLRQALAMTISLQEKAIAYAKSVIPLDRFQVGIKTITGMKNGVPPTYGGFITDASVARAQCEKLLRPQGVGLALFPTSAGFWKECNAGLNEKAPLAATTGNPAQAPLHKEELDRLYSYSRIFASTPP